MPNGQKDMGAKEEYKKIFQIWGESLLLLTSDDWDVVIGASWEGISHRQCLHNAVDVESLVDVDRVVNELFVIA